MTTYTELLPATTSERNRAFTFEPATDDFTQDAGTLTITGNRSHVVYRVQEFPCDEGRGFCLLKKTPGTDKTEDHYSVFISAAGVAQCECKGAHRYGHLRPCKHGAALIELVNAKQI